MSLAAAEALREHLEASGLAITPALCAGHSVGELAALGFARATSLGDCLRLVAARGRLMAEASATADGSMAAVLGLEGQPLIEVCRRASEETGAIVQVANLNAPGQVVLSGNRRSLARACDLARSAGARRVVGLEVSGPFHSVYMQSAADRFAEIVGKVEISAPAVPLVLNVTAQACDDPQDLKRELVVQVTSPVRWSDSVRTMRDLGCNIFVELGPGQVLSGLIKRIARDATVLGVEDWETLQNAAQALLQEEGREGKEGREGRDG